MTRSRARISRRAALAVFRFSPVSFTISMNRRGPCWSASMIVSSAPLDLVAFFTRRLRMVWIFLSMRDFSLVSSASWSKSRWRWVPTGRFCCTLGHLARGDTKNKAHGFGEMNLPFRLRLDETGRSAEAFPDCHECVSPPPVAAATTPRTRAPICSSASRQASAVLPVVTTSSTSRYVFPRASFVAPKAARAFSTRSR